MRKSNILILAFGAVAMMYGCAHAQSLPTEYIIKLSPTELDSVGKGLGFMPFNEAAPLINKIREQVLAQQPKADKPVVVPGDDKK